MGTTSAPRNLILGKARYSLKVYAKYENKIFHKVIPIEEFSCDFSVGLNEDSLDSFLAIISIIPGKSNFKRCQIDKFLSKKSSAETIKIKIKEYYFKRIEDNRGTRIFLSMLFGFRDILSKEDEELFMKLGLSHLLVLSGYQISMLFILFKYLFSMLSINFKCISKRIVNRLALLIIGIFLLIIGFEPSTERAFLAILLVVVFSQIKFSLLSLIINTYLFLIIYNPDLIYSLSFQLTYTSLLSIYFSQQYLGARFQGLKIPLVCTIFSSLVVFLRVGSFSPYGFFINPIVAFPLTIISVPFGVLGSILLYLGIDSHGIFLRYTISIIMWIVEILEINVAQVNFS